MDTYYIEFCGIAFPVTYDCEGVPDVVANDIEPARWKDPEEALEVFWRKGGAPTDVWPFICPEQGNRVPKSLTQWFLDRYREAIEEDAREEYPAWKKKAEAEARLAVGEYDREEG